MLEAIIMNIMKYFAFEQTVFKFLFLTTKSGKVGRGVITEGGD